MMCRRDPPISVVTAPVRKVIMKRRFPAGRAGPVGCSIRNPPMTSSTVRIGKMRAETKLPTFRMPRPCHVIPMEMIVSGTPATARG